MLSHAFDDGLELIVFASNVLNPFFQELLFFSVLVEDSSDFGFELFLNHVICLDCDLFQSAYSSDHVFGPNVELLNGVWHELLDVLDVVLPASDISHD